MLRVQNIMSGLEKRLDAISVMSVSQLRAEWTKVFREVPPDVSADILARAISYNVQERALGSLTALSRRRIKRIAGQLDEAGTLSVKAAAGNDLKPGTRLARDWHGKTHHVLVLDDGFLFEERKYKSLTQIAIAITGTKWSGPRFFGLVKRKAAKPMKLAAEHA